MAKVIELIKDGKNLNLFTIISSNHIFSIDPSFTASFCLSKHQNETIDRYKFEITVNIIGKRSKLAKFAELEVNGCSIELDSTQKGDFSYEVAHKDRYDIGHSYQSYRVTEKTASFIYEIPLSLLVEWSRDEKFELIFRLKNKKYTYRFTRLERKKLQYLAAKIYMDAKQEEIKKQIVQENNRQRIIQGVLLLIGIITPLYIAISAKKIRKHFELTDMHSDDIAIPAFCIVIVTLIVFFLSRRKLFDNRYLA